MEDGIRNTVIFYEEKTKKMTEEIERLKQKLYEYVVKFMSTELLLSNTEYILKDARETSRIEIIERIDKHFKGKKEITRNMDEIIESFAQIERENDFLHEGFQGIKSIIKNMRDQVPYISSEDGKQLVGFLNDIEHMAITRSPGVVSANKT